MDKLKKIFKHDSSDSHTEASHTKGGAVPSSTESAQAPQISNAAAIAIPEKPSGVLMTTNYGDITIALYSDKTPKVRALSPVLSIRDTC